MVTRAVQFSNGNNVNFAAIGQAGGAVPQGPMKPILRFAEAKPVPCKSEEGGCGNPGDQNWPPEKIKQYEKDHPPISGPKKIPPLPKDDRTTVKQG